MSFDPSPLSSTPTPLLDPTDPVPRRGAALLGAGISIVLAIIVAVVSMRFSSPLLFAAGGIKARAQAVQVTAPYRVNGFDYYWMRSFGSPGYQLDTAGNQLAEQHQNYGMNLVVITITANVDKKNNSGTVVDYNSSANLDTYPDDVYKNLAQQAKAAKLVPIFKLALRGEHQIPQDPWPGLIGNDWNDKIDDTVHSQERAFFDSYTDYAVHYAQLAQSLGMPFFIFASDLAHLTTDKSTKAVGDPDYSKPGPGDTYTCGGRRDCEWRHVIAAIRHTSFIHYNDNTATKGGGYTGKIIYAATHRRNGKGVPDNNALSYFEWDPQNFLWWDAVDIIGLSALFPLTAIENPSLVALKEAWQGLATNAQLSEPENGNTFARIRDLSKQTNRPIIFTSAGYESISGANAVPGRATIPDSFSASQGQLEQQNDMQALYETFQPYPWWLGVVWSMDFPIAQRSKLAAAFPYNSSLTSPYNRFTSILNDEPRWDASMQWAGDCLKGCGNPAKSAGVWLNSLNVPPLPVPLP